MKRNSATHLIDLLFPLALFCTFAATSLLVVVIGADVYRRTTEQMDRGFALRTPISYLTQALHRGDLANGVSSGRFGDSDALILSETIDGVAYRTLLYCHDGELKELFARADAPLSPENGQPVTPCASLSITEEQAGLYRIRCVTADSNEVEALAGVRCTPQNPSS